MSFVEINNIKTNYEKKGKKGKPVILLHGWGQNIQMMDYIAEFLKDHFVVYNIDLPGHGFTSEPPYPYGVSDYCDFVKSFCDHFKIKKPIIIAHSFGCRIALMYASKYPVEKMCLTGAAGLLEERGFSYYVKIKIAKILKKIVSIIPGAYEKLQKYAGSQEYRNTSGVMRETFRKVVDEDLRPLLKDIDVETLLVFGEFDKQTPVSFGEIMEKEMPNAALVIFNGDDHFAYFNQWQRFNRVLEAFLKKDYA